TYPWRGRARRPAAGTGGKPRGRRPRRRGMAREGSSRRLRGYGLRAGRSGRCARGLGLQRRDDHGHRAPLHEGHALDLAKVPDALGQRLEDAAADLRVRHLAAPEQQGYLDLIAFLEEALDGPGLERDVVLVGLGAQADFLELDLGGVLARV